MQPSSVSGIHFGKIVAHTGVMFGGKTSGLLAQVDKIERLDSIRRKISMRHKEAYVALSIGAFKHSIDKRYCDTNIVAHSGACLPATPVSTVQELLQEVEAHDYRVVVVDEVQFFVEKSDDYYDITYALKRFSEQNRMVLVAGLDKDFRGLPFGPMGEILAISDERHTYYSVCAVCGGEATHPQRLLRGVPAAFSDPVILPGEKDVYEPRCRACHEVRPATSTSRTNNTYQPQRKID